MAVPVTWWGDLHADLCAAASGCANHRGAEADRTAQNAKWLILRQHLTKDQAYGIHCARNGPVSIPIYQHTGMLADRIFRYARMAGGGSPIGRRLFAFGNLDVLGILRSRERSLPTGKMLILSQEDIAGSITMTEAIRAVENAFEAYANGHTLTPLRISMSTSDRAGHFLYMPSLVDPKGKPAALSIKVYAEFARNPQQGLPLAHAYCLLIDPTDGHLLALLEGMYVTGIRTGAASAVAAKYLAREGAERLGLIGTGFQSFFQAWGLSQVRPIRHLVVYDRSSASMRAFAKKAEQELHLSANCACSPDEVAASSDIVVTATNSCRPVFDGTKLRDGTTVIAIGSFHPNEREVDSETVVRSKIYVDSYEGALAEAGDLLIPIKQGEISEGSIKGELSELVTHRVPGRQSDEEVIFFKAVGLAIEDTAVAETIYAQAVKKQKGVPVSLVEGGREDPGPKT